MTNQEDQGIRLERLIEALGINQSVLARSIKVSPSLINQITKGQKALSHKVLTRLTMGYNQVNANWLLNGDGEMFLSENGHKAEVPEPSVLTGVMEPDAAYDRMRKVIALDDLAGIIASLQAEVAELRRRVEELEGKGGEKDET